LVDWPVIQLWVKGALERDKKNSGYFSSVFLTYLVIFNKAMSLLIVKYGAQSHFMMFLNP